MFNANALGPNFSIARRASGFGGTTRRRFLPTPSNVATKRFVRKTIKGFHEKKFFIKVISYQASSDATTSVLSLSDITQGDTDSTRDGDSCKLTSLSINGRITNPDASTGAGYRMIVFQWLGQDVPTAVEVLGVSGAAYDADSWVQEHYNHDHRRQFRILYDKLGQLGPQTPTTNGMSFQKLFRIRINLGKLAVKKKAKNYITFQAGGTVGTGKLYLIAISDLLVAEDNPVIVAEAKLNFMDG